MNLWTTRAVYSVIFFSLVCSSPSRAADPDVQTVGGPVVGSLKNSINMFLGIPYAQAPLGNLRWQNTQEVKPWTIPLSTKSFSLPCPQIPLPGESGGGIAYSEDCLFLNIWTPTLTPKQLPVMVWFHGGQYLRGSSSQYNGEFLSRDGNVVVVNLNYRLGPMGFLAHPFLTSEDLNKTSGNQAIFDQLQALKWVKANISKFGGDPDNITLFGESSGSVSVCALLASPLAKGYFHKAILQSNACSNGFPNLSQRELIGRKMAKALHCENANLSIEVNCMRSKPIAEVMKALPLGTPLGGGGTDYRYNVDGVLLKEAPGTALRAGRFERVPIMLGTTDDEMSRYIKPLNIKTLVEYRSYVKRNWPSYSTDLLSMYPATKDSDVAHALTQLYSDYVMTCDTIDNAEDISPFVAQTFMYRFTRAPNALGNTYGSFHAAELLYLFYGLLGPSQFVFVAEDFGLMKTMIDVWTGFASTGNPNSRVNLGWKPFTSSGADYMELDLVSTPKVHLKQKQCELWSRVN